jgi:hypothetical protein
VAPYGQMLIVQEGFKKQDHPEAASCRQIHLCRWNSKSKFSLQAYDTRS